MSDLVNHTTQGKAFWYPESAQGAWMGQMGMGTHITPTKSMLVTNTSPIKPRPPPRCFQKVGVICFPRPKSAKVAEVMSDSSRRSMFSGKYEIMSISDLPGLRSRWITFCLCMYFETS